MFMLFEAFDRIFVINLESRKDRRIEMEEQLSHVGLARDARVRFFSAIKTDDSGPFLRQGSHGAFLSHLAILRSQIGRQETVLILQDDCNFLPGAENTVIDKEWDLFYGGYHQLDLGDLHASGIQGAHCMAFRPHIIPPLVEFLEAVYDGSHDQLKEQANKGSVAIAPPIDGAIVWFRRAHPEIRTVFQKISYQRSSRTDIGDISLIDRVPFLARILRSLIRVIRHTKATS
jgi:glycosyl transferase, family 25